MMSQSKHFHKHFCREYDYEPETFIYYCKHIQKTRRKYRKDCLRLWKCFFKSPFAIPIHFIGKISTNMRMKEYYAVAGWINVRAIFRSREWHYCLPVPIIVEQKKLLKNIFTPSWDYPVQRSRLRSVSSGHTSCRPSVMSELNIKRLQFYRQENKGLNKY